MSWDTPVPLDPWTLPGLAPSIYATVRADWHRFTGNPRRDDVIPFPAPIGDTARKITGLRPAFNRENGIAAWGELYLFDDPASDIYAPDSRTQPARMRVVTTTTPTAGRDAQGRIRLGAVTVTTDEPEPGQTLVIPPADMATLRTGYQSSYSPLGAPIHYPPGWPRASWIGSWAVERTSGAGLALVTPASVLPASGPLRDFTPPTVPVSFGGNGIAIRTPIDPSDYVWIRDPHPWIPADRMPPGTRGAKMLSLFGPDRFELITLRKVQARDLPGGPFVAWVPNDRHALRRDANGVWEGSYRHHESGNLLSRFENAGGPFGAVYRALNRTGAIEILFTVAAAAVTLGAGAGIVQAGLAGAGNLAATGPGGLAGAVSGGGAASGGLGAAGGAATGPGGPFGQALTLAIQNQAAIARGALYHPETGDPVLIEASKASLWLQGMDGIWGAALRSLTAGALTPAQRSEFRIAMVELRARIATIGGGGVAIAGAVAQAVRSIVLAVGTGGLAPVVETGLRLAQESAAQATKILNEIEASRALRDLEDAARLEAIRQIDAIIAGVLAEG